MQSACFRRIIPGVFVMRSKMVVAAYVDPPAFTLPKSNNWDDWLSVSSKSHLIKWSANDRSKQFPLSLSFGAVIVSVVIRESGISDDRFVIGVTCACQGNFYQRSYCGEILYTPPDHQPNLLPPRQPRKRHLRPQQQCLARCAWGPPDCDSRSALPLRWPPPLGHSPLELIELFADNTQRRIGVVFPLQFFHLRQRALVVGYWR